MSENEKQFAIQRMFVKDMSFESPKAPHVFKGEWKPQVNLELNAKNNKLDENIYEVVLSITVTVKVQDEVAFIAELQQAAIFQIAGVEGKELGHVLGAYCPNILFPYAREAIDSMITRGSFPPLSLAPVNFDALYVQQMQKQEAEAASAAKH